MRRRLMILVGIALVVTGCNVDRRPASARFQAAPPTTSNTPAPSF